MNPKIVTGPTRSKLRETIWDLDLTQKQKDALARLNINVVYNFFMFGYTVERLEAECILPVAADVNRNLATLGIPRLADALPAGHDRPAGELYAFYRPGVKTQLIEVHPDALEIMKDVRWGNVSKAQKADDISKEEKFSADDIQKIIDRCLEILRS